MIHFVLMMSLFVLAIKTSDMLLPLLLYYLFVKE